MKRIVSKGSKGSHASLGGCRTNFSADVWAGRFLGDRAGFVVGGRLARFAKGRFFHLVKAVATASLSAALMLGLCSCGPVERLAASGGVLGGSNKIAPSIESEEGLAYSSDAYCENACGPYDYAPEIYPGFNTEEYAAVKEHGFTSVSSSPFSTFSADVDTASYCNVRRMINEGYALADIPSGAVRTEEMLNYFTYQTVEPQGNKLFGVESCVSDCPWNSDSKLLVMHLAASQTPPKSEGNNLVFLIDTSGSMDSYDKLDLLKESFSYLVEGLDDEDTISVVTYSGSERVVLDGEPAKNKRRILRAINSLRAEGSTNGESGMTRAYELAEKHFIEGGNNRIILASDGDLNVGISSESELSDFVSKKKESGVYLSVLGFGTGNYKDTKMETIADDGNGAYYYIDCEEEARRIFDGQLCAVSQTVADDVKLQIEFNPAYVRGYRQIGYENRELAAEDFKNDAVDAGEVCAGQSVTVAYELIMADSKAEMFMPESKYGTEAVGSQNGEWLTLSVRYKEAGNSQAHEESYVLGDEAYTSTPTDDWRFAACVAEFGMLANQSENLGSTTFEGLVSTLEDLRLADERRAEFLDLMWRLQANEQYLPLGGADEEGYFVE